MSRVRWLHISDLHFGYNPAVVENLRRKLIEKLKTIEPINFLFITGDLRYGKAENLSYPIDTSTYIDELRTALGINKDSIFIVPGNHDVNRSRELETITKDLKENYTTSNGNISKTTLKIIQEHRQPFREIYKEICGREEPSIHYSIETEYFNIIHINTALISSKDGEDGELIVGASLIKSIENSVNNSKKSIVLAHHTIDSLRYDEQRLLEFFLKDNKSILYLCGHKHVAFGSNINIHRQSEDLWVYVCGTNMDNDHQLESTDMDVFVGEIDSDTLYGHIKAFKWSVRSNAWMLDNDFSSPQNGAEDGKQYFPPSTRPLTHYPVNKSILELYYRHIGYECSEFQLNGLPLGMNVGQKRINLEELFISLNFKEFRVVNNESQSSIIHQEYKTHFKSLDDIIPSNGNFKIAILSGPGGGKTTLLKWIASVYAFPKKYSIKNRHLPDRVLFPIWLKCRDIDCSTRPTIFDMISNIASRAELITTNTVNTAANEFMQLVHHFIQNGTALLLVDGLDELKNDSDRIYFVHQLTTFINSNPKINIIATSRIAGYQIVTDNKLIDFEQYEILPFSDDDIKEFCVRWNKLIFGDRDEILKKSKQLAQNIISHKKIRDLAVNPLMLTTLLLVERKVGRLPTKRVSLYTEAIQVLLETWNLEVHEYIDLDEAKYQLAYIAYQMMKDGKQKITRSELIELLILARKELSGFTTNTDSYASFIRKVERRSAILLQSGYEFIKETGRFEEIYEFQHLTFQEYLAAFAIANKCYPNAKKEDQLYSILESDLTKGNMREVILLSSVLCRILETQDFVEQVINLINSDDHLYDIKAYLSMLLLQIVADEAYLSQESREKIYYLNFEEGILPEIASILKSLLYGKYADEFVKFIEQLDNKNDLPIYSVTLKYLKSNEIAAYEYYENHKQSLDNDQLIDAILILDTALWLDRSKTLNPLTIEQKDVFKEELLQFASHNDYKIQRVSLSALRMSDLLENSDVNRYLNLIVSYIIKNNSIPPICAWEFENVTIINDSELHLNESNTEFLISQTLFKEITSLTAYQEILTYLLILLFFSNDDGSRIFSKLISFKKTSLKRKPEHFLSFRGTDRRFYRVLDSIILSNDLVLPEKKAVVKAYISDSQNEWKSTTILARDFYELDERIDQEIVNLDYDYNDLIRRIEKRIAELEKEEEELIKQQSENKVS